MKPFRLLASFFLALIFTALPKLQAQNNVTTLAGDGIVGLTNGIGTVAQFNSPREVAVDNVGNVYVADRSNNCIRKVTPAGVVTTLVGNGISGNNDGIGAAASFNAPTGVAVDAAGNVYVGDRFNHRIRKITPGGVVTTLAGINAGYADMMGAAARFDNPMGVALDPSGNFLYVADFNNHCIRRLVIATGVVTTVAGNGTSGFVDDVGVNARFFCPTSVGVDPATGNLYVTDSQNFRIRKIDILTGEVSTLAGSVSGTTEGIGPTALFVNPHGCAVDGAGNVYVTDASRVRKITPGGVSSRIAGGSVGFSDGPVATAQFDVLRGLAIDSDGNFYLGDQNNNRIRKISPPATITNFTPTVAASGATVTINGTNFTGTTAVSFGGVAAASFTIVSPTQITAVVASGGASGAVTVTTPGTIAASAMAFTFIPSPTISGFAPLIAASGATVTINGSNFTGASAVSFGGIAAASFTIVNANQITAVVSAGGASGAVAVTTPGGITSGAAAFTFIPSPTIVGFAPLSAASGATVTINGSNFTGATAVSFGGVPAASFMIVNANQITAVVAAGGASGAVAVTSPGGTTSAVTPFTFIPPPTVTGFTPTSAGGGQIVTISGSGFTGVSAVSFGGVSASSFMVVSDLEIKAVVAAGGASGALTVTAPGGTIGAITPFSFILLPTITSFAPTSGSPGTQVLITGTNFTGVTSVRFGGVAASSMILLSATQVVATVSFGASGDVSLVTPGGVANLAGFTFLPPPPTITNFTPAYAGTGRIVTVFGTGFSGATQVRFGGTPAASFTVISPTQIAAVVGGGASGDVAVTTPGGVATKDGFFYVPTPTITSFTPSNAPAGAIISIIGTNFTGATAASFGGIAASSFSVVSPVQINALVAGGSSGNITVATTGGTATLPGFVFIPAPQIQSFSPPSAGPGLPVTILGSNFTGVTSVRFGGAAASSFTVVSPTQINALLSNGATGSVSVTSSGGTASLAGFTFVLPPTLTSFTPTAAGSGMVVTITGTNLTGATSVRFGGVAANSATINSSTQISAVISTGASGSLTVTTPGGMATLAGFTYVPAPTLTSFSPTTGAPGQTVIISGTNLMGTTAVSFGTTAAESFMIISPTQIKAVIPNDAGGTISIQTAGGAASLAGFVFIPAPSITSFMPTSAKVGEVVTIIGTNFINVDSVCFGGVPAKSFVVLSPTTIQAVVPIGITSGNVSVSTKFGTASALGFTTLALPTITDFLPKIVTSGTLVDIIGTNFLDVVAVRFGGVAAASYQRISETHIRAVLGNGASGSVAVSTIGGTAEASGLTFIHPPVITSFTPISATSGATITIHGINFSTATLVSFGGVSTANFTVVSPTRITAVLGTVTSGNVAVKTLAGTATAGGFSFLAPPTISSFSPLSAVSGATVTIWGTRFSGATEVRFGGITAASFTVISPTQIIATLSRRGTSGSITIVTSSGTASIQGFTFIEIPTITSFTPASAARGVPITIIGTNFFSVTAVQFGGITAASFTVISPNEIRAFVGNGRSGNITVTATAGSVSASGFTFIDPPTITNFTPSIAAQGATVRIIGTNLGGTTSVRFGGVTAASFTVISPNEILATLGKGTSGSVAVETTGGTASIAGFLFIPSPTITTFTPSIAAQGVTVRIIGTNFDNTTSVRFGGVTAASFTVISPNEIRATLGRGTSGSVTVETTGGTASISGFSFIPPPTITTFMPTSTSAGMTVTINGTNFLGVSTVRFGGVTAASFTVISQNEIRAVVGGGSGGVIMVITSGGTTTSENLAGRRFVFVSTPGLPESMLPPIGAPLPAPTIQTFAPTSTGKDRIVTIIGTNFFNITSVKFGGIESVQFTVVSPSVITAVVAAGASGEVTVTNSGGTGKRLGFTFVPAPIISSFTPKNGRQGTLVSIRGQHFSRVNRVIIGGVSMPFIVNSATEISVSIPLEIIASGLITLVSPGGIGVSAQIFTIVPPPSITSATIVQSRQGIILRITGNNLLPATTVTIGQVPVAFNVLGQGSITAAVTSGVSQTDIVRVFTPGGIANSSGALSLPFISSISPERGTPGTRIIVTGYEISGTTQVSIGGVIVPFEILDSGRLAIITPSSDVSGTIGLTTPFGVVTTTSTFTFVGAHPSITSITPNRGDIGTEIRILGENLGSPIAVYIGGVSIPFQSSSSSELLLTIPSRGATSGSIIVVTPTGIAVSDEQFLFLHNGILLSDISTLPQARCYPNPASEYVTVAYIVQRKPQNVTLRLFDVSGRLLQVLEQGTQDAGEHFVSIAVKNLSAGIYPVLIEAEDRFLYTIFVVSR